MTKRKRKVSYKKYYQLYLMLMPAIIMVFLFHYLPMYGIQIAFKDFRPALGITGSNWAGIKYFEKFFRSYQFGAIMKNSVLLSLYTLVIGFPMPILLALMVNQIRKNSLKFMVQTITFIPHFISNVTMVGMIIVFLAPDSGIVAHLLGAVSAAAENYIGNPDYFRAIYVISEIWQHTGWDSIIYVCALAAIDQELYEAAEMDGATRLKKMIYINIPSLLPTICIVLVLRTGQIMNLGFEKIFLMQNSLNLSASEVIPTYVYKTGLLASQYSYSAAIGLFNNLINFTLLMIVNRLTKKISDVSVF